MRDVLAVENGTGKRRRGGSKCYSLPVWAVHDVEIGCTAFNDGSMRDSQRVRCDVCGVDRDGRLGFAWGVYGVPESYVIGSDGTVLLRHAGPIDRRVLDEVVMPAIKDAQ